MNPLHHTSGRNPLAKKNLPVASGNKSSNPLARGTMNTGSNPLAVPWETYNLTFRTYEEGAPVIESLIEQADEVLAELGDQSPN